MSSKDTRSVQCAVLLTIAAGVFVTIAFCTTHWLETDGRLANPRFVRLGLWVACFDGFRDFNRLYDARFSECWWNFEEEYYILSDLLFPFFMIVTQLCFTVTFAACLVALVLVLALLNTSDYEQSRLKTLNYSLGVCAAVAAAFGLVACLTFGFNGDRRDWMINWENNGLSWSFLCAVFGTLLLVPAAVLFFVEVKRINFRMLRQNGDGRCHRDPESEVDGSGGSGSARDNTVFRMDARNQHRGQTDI